MKDATPRPDLGLRNTRPVSFWKKMVTLQWVKPLIDGGFVYILVMLGIGAFGVIAFNNQQITKGLPGLGARMAKPLAPTVHNEAGGIGQALGFDAPATAEPEKQDSVKTVRP